MENQSEKADFINAQIVSTEHVAIDSLNLPLAAEFELPKSIMVWHYEFLCPSCGQKHRGEEYEDLTLNPAQPLKLRHAFATPNLEVYHCPRTGERLFLNFDRDLD